LGIEEQCVPERRRISRRVKDEGVGQETTLGVEEGCVASGDAGARERGGEAHICRTDTCLVECHHHMTLADESIRTLRGEPLQELDSITAFDTNDRLVA
jgi:hypothetical protein